MDIMKNTKTDAKLTKTDMFSDCVRQWKKVKLLLYWRWWQKCNNTLHATEQESVCRCLQ